MIYTDVKIGFWSILLIFIMVCCNKFAIKEGISVLNEKYLNNLLNFIKISVPFISKDTE